MPAGSAARRDSRSAGALGMAAKPEYRSSDHPVSKRHRQREPQVDVSAEHVQPAADDAGLFRQFREDRSTSWFVHTTTRPASIVPREVVTEPVVTARAVVRQWKTALPGTRASPRWRGLPPEG